MQSASAIVVVLGTGGTIAGRSADPADNVGYTAAEVGIAALVASVPPLRGTALESEQVAQIDSKDMGYAVWQALAARVAHHAARPEVAGVVVTHGTDTLEETAYFLHRVLAPPKPVVLAGAMRPATALVPDGPQNLVDAVAVARTPGARGVVAVLAGTAYGAVGLRKLRSYGIDAFAAGAPGAVGRIVEGTVVPDRAWPGGDALGLGRIAREAGRWPRVEIVMNHAGADGRIVRDLVAAGVDGLVVAGTGNGTLSAALQRALEEAQAAGVEVRRSTRCGEGEVLPAGGGPLEATPLTPPQARVEMLLALLAG